MSRYMLDTNICIYLMKNQPPAVARRFAQCSVGDVMISAITFAELEFGVLVSSDRVRQRRHLNNLIKSIPVGRLMHAPQPLMAPYAMRPKNAKGISSTN
ncbi:ribonuclease VapC1 [Duganella phyllosphaerae]|uniref:Ribonuclease VapC1 n=1 Tax=Duganella phyllosphaerae TaxID=762836 RepID=A0A1E7WR72_9BURK|nr:ribonuclease VapC1 [Duganella phyllosphaerae]